MTENLKTVKAEPSLLVRESSFVKIKLAADRNPDLVFTSIAHRIDLHLLKRAWRYWLSRRGSNKTVYFDDLKSKLALPKPGIVHNI